LPEIRKWLQAIPAPSPAAAPMVRPALNLATPE
jgi:hypothetical protein